MITIKSTIDKPRIHSEIHTIPEPENIFQKIKRIITKEPRKEFKVVGPTSIDLIKMTILDEIDVMVWMRVLYSGVREDYKKEIQATDKDGITYLFKGCFPIQWIPKTREATFSVDCVEIVK